MRFTPDENPEAKIVKTAGELFLRGTIETAPNSIFHRMVPKYLEAYKGIVDTTERANFKNVWEFSKAYESEISLLEKRAKFAKAEDLIPVLKKAVEPMKKLPRETDNPATLEDIRKARESFEPLMQEIKKLADKKGITDLKQTEFKDIQQESFREAVDPIVRVYDYLRLTEKITEELGKR